MSGLLVKKTLCLFEVDLHAALPQTCTAQLEAVYRLLDTAAWMIQPQTNHIADRYLFQARLERGEQFWTAQHHTKIVSYCWATHTAVEIGEIGRLIRPREGEIYLYDAFTFTAYRGRNLYPALLQCILDQSRQQGLRRALIFVMSDNVASIRGVQKAGFREFQRVIYRNFLGFVRYEYQPALSEAAGVDLLPA